MNHITLATEDELSEAVAIRLVKNCGWTSYQPLRRNGFGYLKSRISNFCDMAIHAPVFLLTDLDQARCAPSLVSNWLNNRPRPSDLLFRVAEKQVESWLLADHDAMKLVLGARARLPDNPDVLDDPKRSLLALAERAPRNVRNDLTAKRGAVSSQGLGYNARLGEMVRNNWSIARAIERSPSLARTCRRLEELALIVRNRDH